MQSLIRMNIYNYMRRLTENDKFVRKIRKDNSLTPTKIETDTRKIFKIYMYRIDTNNRNHKYKILHKILSVSIFIMAFVLSGLIIS